MISYERSWFKKGIHYYKQQEYKIIEKLSKIYSINNLCILMGVNRSGYYKWIKRKNNPSKKTIQIEKRYLINKRNI